MVGQTSQIGVPDPANRTLWRTLALSAIGTLALGIHYTILLGNGSLSLLGREGLDLVFGSMLDHLLHWDFAVDPSAIDVEAWTRDGKTYSYFGIFPALMRLLAMPFVDVTKVGLSRIYCLVSLMIYVGTLLRTLHLMHMAIEPARRSNACLTIGGVAICLSGPPVYLLASAWIYHEPIIWSMAFGAIYNFLILRAVLTSRGFTSGDLGWLGVLAAIVLNTRVSFGIALYATASMLLLWLSGRNWANAAATPAGRRLLAAILDRRFALPVAALAAGAIVAGYVNYQRWGNPLTFADYNYYDLALADARWSTVIKTYGLFDPARIPMALLYYTTGLVYFLRWRPMFSDYLLTHFYGAEAPPFFPLFVNPIWILLACFGVYKVSPCVREVAARIGSRPQGALEDEHGSVWTDV